MSVTRDATGNLLSAETFLGAGVSVNNCASVSNHQTATNGGMNAVELLIRVHKVGEKLHYGRKEKFPDLMVGKSQFVPGVEV